MLLKVMSSFSNPRVRRKNKPKQNFTNNNYRKAISALLKDFEGRCAYSLVHVKDCGERLMEVDHHNPTFSGKIRNNYNNLFPATRHCNGKKSNTWPPKALRAKGIRFLNPCKEGDYGYQIFENEGGELIGVTPAAKYHIVMLDLNDDHLVRRRRERTMLEKLIKETGIIMNAHASVDAISHHISEVKKMLSYSIPPIPSIPAEF